MVSEEDKASAAVIFKLLESGSTSLLTVREFLRTKGLTHSAGSWNDLFTERLTPRLNSGEVTVAELRDLLRSSEECGRQHVFLYKTTQARARAMLAKARIGSIVAEMGLAQVLTSPLDLDMPEEPSIVDIREIALEGRTGILIKQVETRTSNKFLRTELEDDGALMRRVYAVTKKRAVNVARLFDDGLLEVRIAAQDNSTKYDENLRKFMRAIAPLIQADEFNAILLFRAKAEIWNKRDELAEEIRFNTSVARNEFGATLHLSAGSNEENLSTDEGSEKAIEGFLASDGQMIGNDVYFVIQEADPVREVHVLISGEANEFAITAACSPEDFNYVCGKILTLNT